MARLIDADALIEAMRKYEKEAEEVMISPSWWGAYSIIKEQPTAYDIEKVVEKLEKMKKVMESKEFYETAVGYRQAIQIVKRGGVDG